MHKKKLFILRPTMGQGGADRVTLILLQKLDRKLFDLSLVLMRQEGEFVTDVPEDVKVYSLQAANVGTAWLPLAKLLRSEQPDILFSTSSGTNMPAVIAHKLAKQTGRLILSERNVLFHGGVNLKRSIMFLMKRLLYNKADHIISLSQGVKDELVRKLKLNPNLISVAYSPIDIEMINRLAAEDVTHDWFLDTPPIILGAGRFVVEKDFPTLIKAFARVRREREARLVILGEGNLKDELVELVKNLKIENDVWFAGFDKNPFKYMAKCTMFVLSSKHEGLGTVLIQAMACGAPVLATNYYVGASEIVDTGVDGILVPVGDMNSLADKMNYLLDHPEVRESMAKKAKQSSLRFSADVLVEKHVSALLSY